MTHNTGEKAAAASGRDVRRIIGGVLLIALLVNLGAVLLFDRYHYNTSYWLIRYKWRQLLHGPKLDWLILGDSSGNSGFDAGLFSESMGPSYNYCLFVDALVKVDADMLKAYLQRHGAPKGVVLVHTYDIWHRTANPKVVAQTPVPLRRLPEYMVGTPSKARFVRDFLLDRWVPLYAQPASLSLFARHPLELFEPRHKLDAWGYEHWNEQKPNAIAATMKTHIEFTSQNAFAVSQITRDAIYEIARLGERYDFDIYYTVIPIYEGAAATPCIREYFDAGLRFLESVEADCPRFHLLGPFPLTEPAERLRNVDHLLVASTRTFTQTVIERIRAQQQAAAPGALAVHP